MHTILHVAECLGSGVLNYIVNLTKWQIKEYNVVVAYSTRPETPDNFKELFDGRVSFIRVEGFTREIEPVNDIKAFINVKEIVKETKPDLIHLHSSKAGVIGRWAINCNKYNVLYSPHAYSFLMNDCGKVKKAIYKEIERLSDKKRCLTIADSKGEFEASKAVTHNSICIQNGIDIEEMNKTLSAIKERKTRNEKLTICMMGKAVPQKNPCMFNKVAEAFPDYSFIWIGAGPLENELKSSNIQITGWLQRSEALEIIGCSDIFIFTSAWESLSIALLEAMYLAKPCVASSCDGNKDVLADGINGFICDSLEDYVSNINFLVQNMDVAYKIGNRAKEDVEREFNTKVMEKKYKDLFTAIIG